MTNVAHAASRPTSFASFVDNWIQTAQQAILPLILGAAALYFLWGVTRYLRSAGDEKARAEGISYMWWGIIGFVVIFGVWGFVGLVAGLVGSEVAVPQL